MGLEGVWDKRRSSTQIGTHHLLSSTRPSAPDVYLCASAVDLMQNPRPSPSTSQLSDPTSSSTHSHARVIWVDCLARGSEEIKGLCKRLSGKGLDWKGYAERVQVVDAYDGDRDWTTGSAGSVHVGHRDAWSEELHRLLRRLESLLEGAAKEAGHTASHDAKCLVVLDDLNTLAWGTASPRSKISSSTPQGADRRSVPAGAQKEPQRLLAEGMTAWVEELRLICERNSAALITHLHADHTSILDDAHQGISRERDKAARGAGQGFDADDAGEEDADTNIAVQVESSSSESSSDEQGNAQVQKKAVKTRPPIRAAFVDAFDDELFLGVLKNADVWVEMRSLRSGRAVDCHGELCIHPLARPSAAMGKSIPPLPLPSSSDPLRKRRRAWRAAHPDFSSGARARQEGVFKLQAASQSSGLGRALGAQSLRDKELDAPAHFAVRSEIVGRKNAALFELVEIGAKGRGRVEVRLRRRAGSGA